MLNFDVVKLDAEVEDSCSVMDGRIDDSNKRVEICDVTEASAELVGSINNFEVVTLGLDKNITGLEETAGGRDEELNTSKIVTIGFVFLSVVWKKVLVVVLAMCA